MFIEIVIYLVIMFGILVVCMTMFENDNWLENKYYIPNDRKGRIKIKLIMEEIDEGIQKDILYILEKGKYDNIYDIVDEIDIEI